MLKLQRLELSGFKSFVDPATLEFAGGLTSIVGPNGCGKSNLADAVVWVLGERSAKALRGETMDDVIFKGSESRKALGMAEVTLHLATDPTFPHSDDGKLTIGRRVYRSGESTYLLNGRTVRLKEIQDLLMDTGLGIRAYSVIEQGKIGQILSGKPQERRKLLEEAAGITRYKQRKRIAEIKLEEAGGNLERLDDILSEVERSLRSLKRQAGAARRFHERRKLYRELLEKVLLGRWSRLSIQLATLGGGIAAKTEVEAELTANLHRNEAVLTRERETLDRLTEALAKRHRRNTELAAKVEGKQEFIKGSRHRLQEIAERASAGGALADRRHEEIAQLAAALAELEPRRAELFAERSAAATAVDADQVKIAEAESGVKDAETRLETLRGQLMASLGEVGTLRNRVHKEQVEQEKGGYRLRHLAEETEEKAAAVESARAAAELAALKLEQLETAASKLDSSLAETTARLEELESRGRGLDQMLRELDGELAENRQRQQLLTELSEAEAERREALREALEAAGLHHPEFLSERLQAPPGWERSVDLFLGALTNAVVLPEGTDALELAGKLAEGRRTGHLLESLGATDGATEAVTDRAIQASLASALELPDDLARALPPAYLVDQAVDARRLARRHPGIAFLSRERLWAEGGLVHIEGQEARPGALARQRELADIDGRLAELERRQGELTRELETTDAQRDITAIERTAQDDKLGALRRDLAVAGARRDDLQANQSRLGVELETLTGERGELERELDRVESDARQVASDLTAAESRHGELEAAFDRVQSEVTSCREQREQVRTSGVSRRGRLDLLDQRLESLERDLERTGGGIEAGRRHVADWLTESGALVRRRGEIQTAVETAEDELQSALVLREEAERELRGEQELLEECRGRVRSLQEQVNDERQTLEARRQEVGELRVEMAGARNEADHLVAEFREEFGEDPPEEPAAAPDELPEMEADLERFKLSLEKTGPVNELAAEEYDEQAERHEFLTTQRDDVVASIESLRRTIAEINETSSERFRKTFEEVNVSFGETFTQLFRGGQAEMRLLDEEDVLDSGIEIVARPPGKRLQNIMLMSGGEKALTAIALLFALFKTKPSPFCILDEVDAPLDDINTMRFVDMLTHASQETQFIVVTHNKLTMEAASRLYGVTMEERGVSKMVAVELDQIQPEQMQQAASA